MDQNDTEQIVTANTTFVNELESEMTSAQNTKSRIKIKNKSAMESDFTDEQWTIEKMLQKPIKAATFLWSTTDADDSYLPLNGSFPLVIIPTDYLTAHLECMQSNILKSYTFARYAIRFEVQINALRMHTGRALFGYIPITTTNATPTNVSFTRASMYPGIYIDAANANPVSLMVPWVHMQSAFNQTGNYWPNLGLGSLFLKVIAGLTATTNVSSSVELTVWMYLVDAQLRVPVNPALTFLTPVEPTKKGSEYKLDYYDAVGGDNDRAYNGHRYLNEAQGLFDSIGSFFDDIKKVGTGIYSGIENAINLDFSEAAGDFGKAIQGAMDVVDDNPEIMALLLDRPMCLKSEVYSKNMTFSSFAYGIGSDTVTRLDISPYSMYIPNQDVFSGFHDDHNLLNILQRPCLLARFTWNSTDITGTKLWDFTVSPGHFTHEGSNTFLSYISDLFCYWNGTIQFHIDVVASQFHSGRLMLLYSPGYYDSPASALEGTNWPMAVLDLANVSNHRYTFNCEYNAVTPYLKVRENPSQQNLTHSGRFFIYVQNRLVHVDNVATSVKVLVSVSAGKDFHLWCPREPQRKNFVGETITSVPEIGTTSLNQAQAGDEMATPEESAKKLLKTAINQLTNVIQLRNRLEADVKNLTQWIDLVQANVKAAAELLKNAEMNESQAGDVNQKAGDAEEIDMVATNSILNVKSHARFAASMDVRDYIRRYGGVYFGTSRIIVHNNPTSYTLILPVRPRCNGSGYFSNLAYFSRMYALWSGSIRYKILFNNSQVTPMVAFVAHLPDFYVSTPIRHIEAGDAQQYWAGCAQYALKTTNLTNEHGFEVEVPYQSNYHCLTTNFIGALHTYNNGCLVIGFENRNLPADTGKFGMEIYHAAGDDFNFHFPIPPGEYDAATTYDPILGSN